MADNGIDALRASIPEKSDEYTYVVGWERNDLKITEDVMRLWRDHKVLPQGVKPKDRIADLCIAAYHGDELVGVSTANLSRFGMIRARMAFLREFIVPDHREQDVARWILVESKKVMAEWSQANPEQEIMGIAAVLQSNTLKSSMIYRFPRWPLTGMSVCGYTNDGDQIRIAWFDHAMLPEE